MSDNQDQPAQDALPTPPPIKPRRRWRALAWLLMVCVLTIVAGLGIYEMQTSRLQAYLFSDIAKNIHYTLEPGKNPDAYFPTFGPYDERLGYTRMPSMLAALEQKGFVIEAQTRASRSFQQLVDYGLFPIYDERSQAGLTVLDRNGEVLHHTRVPERNYDSFFPIPDLVVNSLLFIENRELLDPAHPFRNPAVEWDRLFRGVGDMALNMFINDEQRVAGGSTLATQIEKYRHSPDGRTQNGREKLRQMASASLRAYRTGENTLESRKRIVLDYINTVPLSAAPGFGEVNGLGDGLWAWYGSGFDAVNALLRSVPEPGSTQEYARALAYKQVLSLFLAQRRPSYYLGTDVAPLEELTNVYLQLLAEAGVIDEPLRNLASKIKLRFGASEFAKNAVQFLPRKAANSVRTRLLSLLEMPSLYTLDRLDLTVNSTLDNENQEIVTSVLKGLKDPAGARGAGLYGFRLLNEQNDLSKIIYSFTLMEKSDRSNLVRIQTDNFEQPLNINEGVKLDLGSTAKLRTLITYLDIIATLHERFAKTPKDELAKIETDPNDRITRWAVDYVIEHGETDLATMLEAAVDRTYSASPAEAFFTGGGLHTFENFDHADNLKVLNVRQALFNSVNLVFIRLMRDIVRYYMFQIPGSTAQLMQNTKDERRPVYLAKFADREGSQFIVQFYKKYQAKPLNEALELVAGSNPVPSRVAAIHRYVADEATYAEFAGFMLSQFPENRLSDDEMRRLYDKYAPSNFSLPDRGFVARVHPLELWVLRHLFARPNAGLTETLASSKEERQAVYQWLFLTRHKDAQDSRIRNLLEVEAFIEIQKQWKKVGYPFDTLVPSYATSIGSSGDRPAALAEMMGILVNDGMYYPTVRVNRMHFARGTPYETVVKREIAAGERVLAPEVAQLTRKLLAGVIEGGTARRVHKSFMDNQGNPIVVGGKTGTGDHRFETFGPGGKIVSSEVVNRTATFVFYIGDRFFGTVVAYVPGKEAANYKFTSSLPAQLLKALAPAISPLINAPAKPDYTDLTKRDLAD